MMTEENSKKKIQINLDRELADQAQAIFDQIGINQTSALTAFYKKVVAEGGLPFELKISKKQYAKEQLREAIDGLPVEDLTDPKKLQEWFDDDTQDY
ncbi:MAG TPA: type II toxin-antitoxin system antitoxin, RelB/DinJ family [Lactobacillus sp.]|nr:type II toxin-antitoxin system antitoxin, RelB/DinJ family [Lactobacillus sp.]